MSGWLLSNWAKIIIHVSVWVGVSNFLTDNNDAPSFPPYNFIWQIIKAGPLKLNNNWITEWKSFRIPGNEKLGSDRLVVFREVIGKGSKFQIVIKQQGCTALIPPDHACYTILYNKTIVYKIMLSDHLNKGFPARKLKIKICFYIVCFWIFF